jgi:hypothetical protein
MYVGRQTLPINIHFLVKLEIHNFFGITRQSLSNSEMFLFVFRLEFNFEEFSERVIIKAHCLRSVKNIKCMPSLTIRASVIYIYYR